MSYFYKNNPVAEHLIGKYFQALEEKNDCVMQGRLSIMLLGSLSRGEGTWIERENGLELLSDIEFFTIYPSDFSDFNRWNKILDDTRYEVFIGEMSLLFHIDNTYVCRDDLPDLERKLLTFDAQNMGITVVGEDLKNLISKIDIHNINYYDLKDIMTHRVFSVLYYGFPLKRAGDEISYQYSLAKNSLDLMTVMLVKHGQLLSGFRNRCQAIQSLNVDERIRQYFQFCLEVKLGQTCNLSFTINEMEHLFIFISDQLYKEFKVPIHNIMVNWKSIIKRNLGKIKRAVRYKHFVYGNHYKRLSATFKRRESVTEKEILDNIVLNGYPIGKKTGTEIESI